MAKWQSMRSLEIDGGPKKSKRGSPSFERTAFQKVPSNETRAVFLILDLGGDIYIYLYMCKCDILAR